MRGLATLERNVLIWSMYSPETAAILFDQIIMIEKANNLSHLSIVELNQIAEAVVVRIADLHGISDIGVLYMGARLRRGGVMWH